MLILSALQKCQKITNLTLHLSQSNVNLDLAKIIASALEKCQNITNLTLDLRQNNLSQGEQKVIYDQLKNTLKKAKEITVKI
ncbi:kinase domain protein (macronuclear) [Tetrahymena thermophila SB210]|uniref:Kinase domain protein n=1 Tax=Tetrahymena thermophila (strain SB210) TaxID=312017 RepID=Q228G5_TETTS|nr:kinase domain protein [Tetrahymena thermophila SB210]EAR81685.1 kinase domain protein [Tetrahymena thermophila SB210]|eukprot:XP_001029348.1 kinase domain protein [Tetrahymena thermophila SB210]